MYNTYRNGKKVEEINATVLAVLKEVVDIKADADQGREMTERDYRLTRELLDSYASRLSSYEGRLAAVERDMRLIRAQLALWRYRNRVCQAKHVWRTNLLAAAATSRSRGRGANAGKHLPCALAATMPPLCKPRSSSSIAFTNLPS